MLTPKELSKLIGFDRPEEYPVMTEGEIELIINDHSYISTRADNCICGEAGRLGVYSSGILLVRHVVYVMAFHGCHSVENIDGFGDASFNETLSYLRGIFGRLENLDTAMSLVVKNVKAIQIKTEVIKEAFRMIMETVDAGELYDNGDVVFSVCGEDVGSFSVSKDSVLRLVNNALKRQFNEVGYS